MPLETTTATIASTPSKVAAAAAAPAASAPGVLGPEWWRTAVIYQIYPRSFADANGDGIGDLPGITDRLPALANLGVDAVWLSPFFTSPQHDAGYDVSDYCDVDPLFGTLADFDRMLETAHGLGLKVIIDMVPNHTSADHVWFQEALAAPEGSPERDRYMFRDGKGPKGDIMPNNWESVFGGPMWERVTNPDGTPGQWYLHIFDKSQPDLNWENPWVRSQFRDILRFWLDRGVDGFRVDVAHGMIKAAGLPDYTPPAEGGSMGGDEGKGKKKDAKARGTADANDPDSIADAPAPGTRAEAAMEPGIEDPAAPPDPPYWGQEGVHDIWREWHSVLAEYEGDRVLCAEAWVGPLTKMAKWVRPDEMSQAFNFDFMFTDWTAPDLRRVIDESIAAFGGVGAPSTWVLSNHDVVRHASRLALTAENPQGSGIGPKSPGQPDPVLGLRRARAASALMLALPGGAYLYQGEELGLPEVVDLPDSARQDPTWFRTNGEKYGRDGCRVPIPWEADAPGAGFNSTGEAWLPQPANWGGFARDVESADPDSTLNLYTEALRLRRDHDLGSGNVHWVRGFRRTTVALRNHDILVIANLGKKPVALPAGAVLLASGPLEHDGSVTLLPSDTTVWLQA
jgi:alpha-glucosidase